MGEGGQFKLYPYKKGGKDRKDLVMLKGGGAEQVLR